MKLFVFSLFNAFRFPSRYRGLLTSSLLLSICMMPCMLAAQTHKFDRVMHFGDPAAVGTISCGDVYKNRTIVTDDDGNLFVTGNFKNSIEFDLIQGGTVLNSVVTGASIGNQGRYIARYSPEGDLLWVKQFGNDSFSALNVVTAIDLDADRNIYIVGHFTGSFNTKPAPDDSAIFTGGSRYGAIFKLDSNGNHIWTKTIFNTYIHGIRIDRQQGILYAAGSLSGTQDFDPDPVGVHNLSAGGYVLKWTTDAQFIWARSWPGATAYSVDFDPQGNVNVAGKFSGSNHNFNTDPGGSQIMSSAGGSDIFVSSFNASGDFRWAKTMGAKSFEECYYLETDAHGNSYITGSFSDTVDFGGTTLYSPRNNPSSALSEAYFAKFSNTGDLVWATQLFGSASNAGYSLTLGRGAAAGVFVTGVIRGGGARIGRPGDTLRFALNASAEGFVAILDTATGYYTWGGALGGSSSGSVAVDQKGNLYTAGYISSAVSRIDFDPGPDTFYANRIGNSDGFITKLSFCQPSETRNISSCGSYEHDGIRYYESGTYTFLNPFGCDTSSKLILNLEIHSLDPEISPAGNTLHATPGFDSYQWLRNDTLIPGETGQSYEVVENGGYSVAVTTGSDCADTSRSYYINNLSLASVHGGAQTISVYPNPATDQVTISCPEKMNVRITSADGRQVYSGIAYGIARIPLGDLAAGLYLIKISDMSDKPVHTEKLIRIDP